MGEISDNIKAAPRARKVLNTAQHIAQRHNHAAITPEHILLALVEDDEGVVALALTQLGIDLGQLQEGIESTLLPLPKIEEPAESVGMTPRAKKVMAFAIHEAGALRQRGLGAEHLLLGIMREESGPSVAVLQGLGLTEEKVRAHLMALVALRGALPSEGGPKNNVVTCRLDDNVLDALDALVEAGIRSSRSDAVAWLLAAGINAHKELFDRVYTTVAEIRQLRSEAQSIARKVVETGRSGTAGGSGASGRTNER
jgi:ATP-dependent Clp protease ATP-binding subunit ClpA